MQELTGWDPNQLFLGYMQKVREKREEDLKHAEEDALMAMVDAMNAGSRETAEDILRKASQSISEKTDGQVDPATTLTVQAILACLGDRVSFEEADELREAQEERAGEVTQQERTGTDPVH